MGDAWDWVIHSLCASKVHKKRKIIYEWHISLSPNYKARVKIGENVCVVKIRQENSKNGWVYNYALATTQFTLLSYAPKHTKYFKNNLDSPVPVIIRREVKKLKYSSVFTLSSNNPLLLLQVSRLQTCSNYYL